MPTAICRIFTPEGFVIAADGRKIRVEDDGRISIINDSAQKIFSIEQPGRSIAYAITGNYSITPVGSDRVAFDFEREIPRAIASLERTNLSTLFLYVEEMCEQLRECLVHIKRNRKKVRLPDDGQQADQRGSTIAYLLFDGYYNGLPSRVSARFFHESQKLAVPDVRVQDLHQNPLGSGSPEVFRLLHHTNDPRFSAYRYEKKHFEDLSLTEAIEIARNYIHAQCDPEALKIDEKTCSAIGGNVHIATITPHGGFHWVAAPL